MQRTLLVVLMALTVWPALAAEDVVWVKGCETPLKVARVGDLASLKPLDRPLLEALSASMATQGRNVEAAFSNADLSLLVTYNGVQAEGQIDDEGFETLKATFLKNDAPLPDNVRSVNPGPFKAGPSDFRQSFLQVLERPDGKTRQLGYGDVWVHFGACLAIVSLVATGADLKEATRLLDLISIP